MRVAGREGRGKPSLDLRKVALRAGRIPMSAQVSVRDFPIAVQPHPSSRPDLAPSVSLNGAITGATMTSTTATTMRANFKNGLRLGKEIGALFLKQAETIRQSVARIMTGLSRCIQRERPGRSYQRISRQPRSKCLKRAAA